MKRATSHSILAVIDHVSFPGKKFCQFCADSFIFWALVAALSIVEPILCTQYTHIGSFNHRLQVIVLAASSMLYFIQLIGVATREWEKIVMIEALTSISSLSVPKKGDFSFLKLFIFFTAEGEYILEFICLAGGWSVIFIWPGIAALRCFRVFRLLWCVIYVPPLAVHFRIRIDTVGILLFYLMTYRFYEVQVFKSSVEHVLGPLIGRSFVSRGFKVLKFAIKSLTALGNELFRLTTETRGALLLIMVLVYSAFVIGMALWIETESSSEFCGNIGECTFTLMRLTFFDGDGFDFAFFLTRDHRIMFMVVMVYMCLTSFGILNGLVGIFGTAIATASELAFNGDEQQEETVGEYSDSEGGDEQDLDDDVESEFNDLMSSGGIIFVKEDSQQSSEGGSSTGRRSKRKGDAASTATGKSPRGREQGKRVRSKTRSSTTAKDSTTGSASDRGHRKGIADGDSAARANGAAGQSDRNEQKQAANAKGSTALKLDSVEGNAASYEATSKQDDFQTLTQLEQDAVRMKLAAALGSKSSFAQSQFKSAPSAVVKMKPKLSFKDLVQHSLNNKDKVMSRAVSMKLSRLSPNTSPRPGAASPVVERRRVHPTAGDGSSSAQESHGSRRPAPPVGLFGAKGVLGKSLKNIVAQAKEGVAAAAAAGNAHGGASGIATQRDVNVLLTNIHSLNRRIETQNDMIVALYTNIQFLNHQLQKAHPELALSSADFHPPAMVPSKNFAKNAHAKLPVSEHGGSNDPLGPLLLPQKSTAVVSHGAGAEAGHSSSHQDLRHHSSAFSLFHRGSGGGGGGGLHETPAAPAASPAIADKPPSHHLLSSTLGTVVHAVEGALEVVDHGFDRALESAAAVFKTTSGSDVTGVDAAGGGDQQPDSAAPNAKSSVDNGSAAQPQGQMLAAIEDRSPSQLSEISLSNEADATQQASTHTRTAMESGDDYDGDGGDYDAQAGADGTGVASIARFSAASLTGEDVLQRYSDAAGANKLAAASAESDVDDISVVSKVISPSIERPNAEPHLLDDLDVPVTQV